jgi:hypothetical protein
MHRLSPMVKARLQENQSQTLDAEPAYMLHNQAFVLQKKFLQKAFWKVRKWPDSTTN